MIDIRGLEVLLRQIFGSCAKSVAMSFSCRYYSNHFPQKNLECAEIRLTFASSIRTNKTSERQQKENLKIKIVLTIKN